MGCSCGSAVWLNVTATVCIDSDQILGHLTQPDPGVKIGRGSHTKTTSPLPPTPPLPPTTQRHPPSPRDGGRHKTTIRQYARAWRLRQKNERLGPSDLMELANKGPR